MSEPAIRYRRSRCRECACGGWEIRENALREKQLRRGPWAARGGVLLELFLAERYLPLPHGARAAGAEVIVDFLFRQDQEEPFAHGHGRLALGAIETGRAEIVELLHGIFTLG